MHHIDCSVRLGIHDGQNQTADFYIAFFYGDDKVIIIYCWEAQLIDQPVASFYVYFIFQTIGLFLYIMTKSIEKMFQCQIIARFFMTIKWMWVKSHRTRNKLVVVVILIVDVMYKMF